MRCNEITQKFPCFFHLASQEQSPLPRAPAHFGMSLSSSHSSKSSHNRSPLTNWLGNITITILSPLWLQPNPLQFPSAPGRSQPVHLQPSGIFNYIPPHPIIIMMPSSVQSPSSTDRVKLKVPMILESCKVIMKGSRKKPATLSRHEGPLKRRKAC